MQWTHVTLKSCKYRCSKILVELYPKKSFSHQKISSFKLHMLKRIMKKSCMHACVNLHVFSWFEMISFNLTYWLQDWKKKRILSFTVVIQAIYTFLQGNYFSVTFISFYQKKCTCKWPKYKTFILAFAY